MVLDRGLAKEFLSALVLALGLALSGLRLGFQSVMALRLALVTQLAPHPLRHMSGSRLLQGTGRE